VRSRRFSIAVKHADVIDRHLQYARQIVDDIESSDAVTLGERIVEDHFGGRLPAQFIPFRPDRA
jgi:hypothetical protein